MDDSNTAASTSTAATVANGAQAVGDDKSTACMRPSTYSVDTVKLLIKASNQQYDDHAVDGDLQWTVKRLKAHLADVYPSKPAISEQKLIYSGQLLNDNLLLKDVIRNYKDICTQNHVIHLVCSATQTTVKKPPTSTTPGVGSGNHNNNTNNSTTSAIRNGQSQGSAINSNENTNFVSAGVSANVNQPTQNHFHQEFPMYPANYNVMWQQMRNMQYSPWNGFGYPANPQYAGMPFMANQNPAMYNWLQQVYSQYMEQYLRAMRESETTTNTGPNDSNSVGIGGNSPYFGLFMLPFNANPNVNMPPVIMPLRPNVTLNNSQSTSNAMQNPPVVPANNEPQPRDANPQQNDAQVPVIGRQFRNIPEEEPNNRDWLDSIFIIMRILLFVTIFYFNFSPVRYLIVIAIATIIFSYHTGILRITHERNNNNVNRNNNAAEAQAADAANAVDQIRQGVEQEDHQAPGAEAAAGDVNQLQSTSVNANNVNTNTTVTTGNRGNIIAFVISFLRTFVVTFFTSLLPETPAI